MLRYRPCFALQHSRQRSLNLQCRPLTVRLYCVYGTLHIRARGALERTVTWSSLATMGINLNRATLIHTPCSPSSQCFRALTTMPHRHCGNLYSKGRTIVFTECFTKTILYGCRVDATHYQHVLAFTVSASFSRMYIFHHYSLFSSPHILPPFEVKADLTTTLSTWHFSPRSCSPHKSLPSHQPPYTRATMSEPSGEIPGTARRKPTTSTCSTMRRLSRPRYPSILLGSSLRYNATRKMTPSRPSMQLWRLVRSFS
jgi:hypothetical protein